MLKFAAVIFLGLVALGVSEIVRKRFRIHNEDSRKIYHVVHAIIIAIAPFLVSYNVIIVLELLLLGQMILVRHFNLLPWLYKVGRISWGEYFGVVGVVAIALIRPNEWVFFAAILHLGLADAAAAVIGKRFGKKQQFKVLGQKKSYIGSAAFFLTSVALTYAVVFVAQPTDSGLLIVAILPLLTTAAEAVSPFGLDNLVIPGIVVAVLGTLQFAI